ncbi:MAG: hypothetical protein LCH73_02815 [Proteobacteria bacterium]|nr:hypothetical protein [Pseudomonadota bacterium]
MATRWIASTDPVVERALDDVRRHVRAQGAKTKGEVAVVCSVYISVAAAYIRDLMGADEVAGVLRTYADSYAAEAQFEAAKQTGPAPSQEVH